MAPLAIDWIVTAGLAACLGWAGPKSFKAAAGLCVWVALLGWAARGLGEVRAVRGTWATIA